MVTVTYKTPLQAAEIGTYIVDEVRISADKAEKLRDLYKSYETGAGWSAGAVATILGGLLAPALGILFGLGTSTAVTLASDYFQTLDNDFDALIKGSSMKTCIA